MLKIVVMLISHLTEEEFGDMYTVPKENRAEIMCKDTPTTASF